MSDVTDLNKFRMRARGENMFVCCKKCGGHSFAVVAVAGGDQPVVSSLVCLDDQCEGQSEMTVSYGRIEGPI